jgi:hypothetical protein
MNMLSDVERQFRALHEDSVQEYEARVKRWQGGLEQTRERGQADEEEIRESLKSSGVDVALLDRRARRAADELQAYLDETRKGLVERTGSRAADFKQRALEASLLTETCQTQITPYAVSLMANDPRYLEGIEGERGNPWILPYNPGQIKLWDKDKGDGWGCWASASGPPPTATVWFTFVPDQTARWELSPIFVFHGFYIMRADDGIFTCKFAEVELEAKVDIFQYFWKGVKEFSLIHVDKDDVNLVEFYDRTHWLWDTTTLRAGDRAWVKVDVSVKAFCSGGGSYAELNFSEGAGNYIEPLLMTAQVV